MKNLIIINVVSVVLLFMVLASFTLFGGSLPYTLLALWVFFTLGMNYNELIKSKDLMTRLEHSNRYHFFNREVHQLKTAYLSIRHSEGLVDEYGEDSGIHRAYNVIYQGIVKCIESAIRYMNSYDKYRRPYPEYLHNQINKIEELLEKMNELKDLILQFEDVNSDVDTAYVDAFAESLKEMINT